MTGVCSEPPEHGSSRLQLIHAKRSFRRFSVYKTSKHAGGLSLVVKERSKWWSCRCLGIVHRGAPRSESTVRIARSVRGSQLRHLLDGFDSDVHLLKLRASTFGAAGLG